MKDYTVPMVESLIINDEVEGINAFFELLIKRGSLA